MVIELASLDTSFWTVGHRADVLSYLFTYFEVRVPPAVRMEILAVDPVYPHRRYGYAEIFRLLEGRGLLQSVVPSDVDPRYGAGEAEAITIARERGWWLLINDRRPLAYARDSGIRVLSVPAFVVYLYLQQVLSFASSERKLTAIAAVTSSSMLEPARQMLDELARTRKERP